ncbi:hypothetical protein H0H81_009494 [Sphagnurus paluster]|uniref:Uncharacterized protein n=1 Tax=Sphagnurus paluster TaxID=117069 RepID=A0A9P7GVQ4_9AGAR|nr:hypothetical protein H0H81_009494 [Sphagnurus paluster]
MPPNTTRILDIASGANHTVLLLETRSIAGNFELELWGSGDGSSGQLGPVHRQLLEAGSSTTVFRPLGLPISQLGLSGYKPRMISASWETTYIVFSHEINSDVLVSMGKDDFGDLGVGGGNGRAKGKGKEKIERASLNIVSFAHLIVDGFLLGDAALAFRSIEAGQHHVLVHFDVTLGDCIKSCIAGWGASRHGQLGAVFGKDGKPVPYLPSPTLVTINDDITYIALGNQHTVLLNKSGKVLGLGSNRKGQLQRLEQLEDATHIGCTWNGTYVITGKTQGTTQIHAMGSGMHGQLGRLHASAIQDPGTTVELDTAFCWNISLACGTEHILALLSLSPAPAAPEVWGWGWNEHGNLGTGKTDDISVPVKLWPPVSTENDDSPRALRIWAGCGTSWIFTTS